MTPDEFKQMVLVKLELLRGCCNVPFIKKKQIEQSIEKFAQRVQKVTFTSQAATQKARAKE